jgi:hypothetical protein
MKQTKLSLGPIKLCELSETDAILAAPAVEPVLTAKNAGSRFVHVPASQFDATGIGGWIAKITKVARNADQTTTLRFKDADGAQETHYFKFAHVVATFKLLS